VQTLTEIRQLLIKAGIRPRRRLGQNFLIDRNLMAKLVELAQPEGQFVVEVGAATGSLTEELLPLANVVLAVEMDPALAGILRRRLGGRDGLTVLECDFLASKRAISPAVAKALPSGGVHVVSNLPYAVAVPVITNCLLASWLAVKQPAPAARFERLTFTVQRELAKRLTAPAGTSAYGPAAVIVALLAKASEGRAVPPQAFWPRPKVTSQMLRLDFDATGASQLDDADALSAVLSATFRHRRKKTATASRKRGFPFPGDVFVAAAVEAGVDPASRPHQIPPGQFRAIANVLSKRHPRSNLVQ